MQASVRLLAIAAVAVVAAVLVAAGAPAALAYEDPGPVRGDLIQLWNPQYTVKHFARKPPTEGGPVELPHPVEPPPGMSATMPGATPTAPQGGKSISTIPGGLPTGRGAAVMIDPAALDERRIQQVIRRLG